MPWVTSCPHQHAGIFSPFGVDQFSMVVVTYLHPSSGGLWSHHHLTAGEWPFLNHHMVLSPPLAPQPGRRRGAALGGGGGAGAPAPGCARPGGGRGPSASAFPWGRRPWEGIPGARGPRRRRGRGSGGGAGSGRAGPCARPHAPAPRRPIPDTEQDKKNTTPSRDNQGGLAEAGAWLCR